MESKADHRAKPLTPYDLRQPIESLSKEGSRMEGTLNFDSLDIGANF